ncbi:Acg family FMN-binding oxidoreductase [Cellulomonas endophytica]|uniref:Acg family FMN-binding oxidoreductase n=1 Tax=Cellulomonas endophytica TaxID=2494735 RepID=UPI001010B869|nr:nitroreductase family protein [Cellulomonas endophytica]
MHRPLKDVSRRFGAVAEAVRDATLAASVHNSQPWRFVVGPSTVEVHLDDAPRPAVVDPDGRWALASLGAATANLEIGLRRRLGRDVEVVVHLRAGRTVAEPGGGAVAEVRCGADRPARVAPPGLVALHDAIPHRRTSRAPLPGPLPEGALDDLRAAARLAPGVVPVAVHALADEAAARLLDLTAAVDARWRDDPAYLAELDRWAHVTDGRGVPPAAFGPRDSSGRVPGRDFSRSVDVDRTPPGAVAFEAAPQLLVLTTAQDDAPAWFATGMALQRVALAATVRGLAVGVLGQVVEDPAARVAASALFGGDASVGQVLRVGVPAAGDGAAGAGATSAPRAARTPRRPLADVVARGE